MRWKALATDFDGTIASDGHVADATCSALAQLRADGLRVLLVTGRELSDFASLDLPIGIFDLVVAENGAVLHDPHRQLTHALGPPPPAALVAALEKSGATPLSVGASIVATREPYETVVLESIKELGLEHQVIFNKGAVMVLPPGVNKASGLRAALDACGLDACDVVGVGDAENDHAFLEVCGCGVAVANALPALKERADWVTKERAGAGVVELIAALRAGELDAIRRV